MPFDAVEILQQLVAIPSVNPMGRPADGSIFHQRRSRIISSVC